MRRIKAFVLRLGASVALALLLVSMTPYATPTPLHASSGTNIADKACDNLNQGTEGTIPGCGSDSKKLDKDADGGAGGFLRDLLNVFFYAAGAAAIIFIIIGAIQYITSSGDAKRVQQGKETVFYAVVGLIVVVLAQAIIGFVINRLGLNI